MTRHTPPPWTLELRAKHLPKAVGGHHTIRVENRLIATCPAHRLGGKDTPLCLEECEANARVMAAAPELLQALKAITEIWPSSKLFPDDLVKPWQEAAAKASRAIAKAEGTDK